MRKYIVEFIGTFFWVLAVCMTAFSKVSADLQPLAIGLIIAAMVYAGGYISGGQYNPAVSFAIWLRGKISIKEMGFYITAQILGGLAAALFSFFLTSAHPPVFPFGAPPQYFGLFQASIAELVGSFALVWVFLNVATSKSVFGNNYYGLAIGLTFTGLSYTLGNVSGAAFNPAVALAVCVSGLGSWSNLAIYLAGSFVGAALAAFAYRFINPEE
jgi:aquaporin Z